MKVCTKCKEEKEFSEFAKKKTSKDGLRSRCKSCTNEDGLLYRIQNRNSIRQRRAELFLDNPEKYRNMQRKSARRLYREDPERFKEKTKKYKTSAKGVAYRKKWLKDNPDKTAKWNKNQSCIIARRRYKKENPHKVAAYTAKRRALKLNATPPWVDQEHLQKIAEVYKSAKTLSEFHEEVFHVDHIEPLQGKTSCGLHVFWNLRPILAKDNLIKANKLEST